MSDLNRVLGIYPNATEVQELSCIDNVEWSYELSYYFRDIRADRKTIVPGCMRKIYKIEDELGVIDIRPWSESSRICEAWLPVPKKLTAKVGNKKITKKHDQIFCSCCRRYSLRDLSINIDCVPYFMPDGKLSVCAQCAMKIMVNHFAHEFDSINITMPQLQKRITGGDPFGSDGLTAPKVLHGLNGICGKVLYYYGAQHPDFDPTQLRDEQTRLRLMKTPTLHAYIESELPVYLVFKTKDLWWWEKGDTTYHAIVAIGHTLDPRGNLDFFLVHDESMFPYRLLPSSVVDECLLEAIVMLPPKVNVRFENALNAMLVTAAQFNEILRQELKGKLSIDLLELSKKRNVVFRSMLVSSIKIKEWYTDSTNFYNVRDTTKDVYRDAELPAFVWLFEFKEKNRADNQNFAQVLINATEGTPKLSLINFPDGALKYKNGLDYTHLERPDPLVGDSGLRKDKILEKWKQI